MRDISNNHTVSRDRDRELMLGILLAVFFTMHRNYTTLTPNCGAATADSTINRAYTFKFA